MKSGPNWTLSRSGLRKIEVELRAALVADGESGRTCPRRVRWHPGHPRGRPPRRGNWNGLPPPLPWPISSRPPLPTARPKAPPPSYRSIWVSAAIKSRWSCSKFAPRPIPPAPTDGEPVQSQFVPAVFPGSIAAFLGIAQPSVAAGQSSYHVLSTNLTANVPGAGVDGANTAGAFTSAVLEPKRVQGAFVLRREDKARLGPQLEAALRENLGMVLSTKLDQELLTGDDGFMAAANPAIAKPGNPAAVATYGDFVKGVSDQVDGLYADTVAGVRILLGPSAYKLGLATYRAGTQASPAGGDLSALERVQALSGGVRASSHIPAVANKTEQALAARATGLTHMVQPVWQGPTLIVDEVTRADSGEIVLTLVGLFAQKLVRAAGFARVAFKTS